MKGGRSVAIGTRGSPLAIAQANIIARMLKRKNKGIRLSIRKIKTEGDSQAKVSAVLTGKDLFTRAIDKALLQKQIDIAVHSLKDVPVDSKSNKIEIVAYPKRENPLDVLVSRRRGDTLETLPQNARVGTSSLRRAIQLKSFRPDIEIVEIHGNVQTRIVKLGNSELDAIVLAKAGLKRLRKNNVGKTIPDSVMLPAVGQGCLAVAIRTNDDFTRKLVSHIDHRETRIAVSAERAFSKELGGGCNTPIAALATVLNGKLYLDGLVEKVTSNHSKVTERGRISGSTKNAELLGKTLAKRLKRTTSGQ
ncbi:MAG: hydroxymethylbilane synthase [Nitrososphaerota archaeon]|nr:hydroxymethylbilane synthase [Nitrososphaerota archaeon]